MALYRKILNLFRKPKRSRLYAGANINRFTANWLTAGTNADSEIRSSLQALRNRARQLCRDSDYARQALRTITSNVIGQGIQFQSQVKMQRGSGRLNNRVNDLIESEWHKWCNRDSCDVGGRLSFHEIERLILRSCAESGEVFIRMVYQPFGYSKIPFALEIIEADLCVDDYNGTAVNGNEIRMGVEIDEWSRPTAYYFYAGMRHPGDYLFQKTLSTSKYIRVPADEIIHLYIVDRPGQTRGITWFASAIERLHHLSGYEQAEVINARATASLMGFIQSPEGELIGEGTFDGDRVTTFEPGVFKYLAPGETVTVPPMNHDRSGSAFVDFLQAMLRATAAGLGCSYEGISQDYSQTNYSSSRLALLCERDYYRQLQHFLISIFHKHVYYKWLDVAVLSGALPLPRYEIDPDFYRMCRFIPRSWAWVDPLKEIAAYKEAEMAGYITKSQIIAESGGDLQEVFMQKQSELALAKELGLSFDTTIQPMVDEEEDLEEEDLEEEDIEEEEDEDDDIEEDDEEDRKVAIIDEYVLKYKRIPDKYSHINFKPPSGARNEAKRGLAWRREFGRGGTSVGVARARDISNGKQLSPSTVKRMKSFFARHEVDKQAEGFSPGEKGYPSNGRIAWALWGGDSGKSWANKVVNQINAADEEDNQ